MAKFILFTNGVLSARYDSAINDAIPAEAIEVGDELFFQTINETDGVWSLVDGNIVKLPFPEPTPEQLAASIRAERDRKIADVAWRYERIARQERLGITPTDNITALDAYVQALADITAQATFPQSVTWPEVPA